MTITLNYPVTVSAFEIRLQNTRNEIMDFIMKLDFEVAEADFTETLIIKLANALASDSKTSTMVEIGNKIAAMQGYKP